MVRTTNTITDIDIIIHISFLKFAIIETVVTAIVDEFPDKLRNRKPLVLAVVCIVGYLLGLICVTEV